MARECCGLGRWAASVSKVSADRWHSARRPVRGTLMRLADSAAALRRLTTVSVNWRRDQLYSHKCFRELVCLSPSLENCCFCYFFQNNNNKIWLCLSLLLLSTSILLVPNGGYRYVYYLSISKINTCILERIDHPLYPLLPSLTPSTPPKKITEERKRNHTLSRLFPLS